MKHIGQSIIWGTAAAPRPCSGVCTQWSYEGSVTRQLDKGESGAFRAAILHSKKARINFGAKVSADSTDFLDLSSGPVITIEGVTGGVICARRAVERWVLLQPKTISVEAMHYPDMALGSGESAGVTVDAFVPDQSGLTIIHPGGELIWGTHGFTHTAGIVHEFEIAQELELDEDEPSPAGTLLGVQPHGYLRTIRLKLLAGAAATKPVEGAVLTVTGAPTRGTGFRVEKSAETYNDGARKMFDVDAFWFDGMN